MVPETQGDSKAKFSKNDDADLRNRGYAVNHKRVLKLMQEDNLLCLKKDFKPITTDSNHGLPVYPNLLKSIQISRPNQVWVSDITYVQLMHEHIYLAVIIDLFSRKCIVWDLNRNMGIHLTMNALENALKNRWTESLQGLIHQFPDQFEMEAALNTVA